jgi:ADP-ribose pyrophosphatase
MSTRIVFDGRIVRLVLEESTLPNGKPYVQEIVRHPGGACAVPIFDDGSVLMLWQHRVAAGGSIWEVPAGKLDKPGEDPEGCAARELSEEAGFRAEKLTKIAEFFTSPGFCDEVLHVFKATGLVPVETNREEHEVMSVHRFTREEVAGMIARGEIRDAKTLVGLFACGYGCG